MELNVPYGAALTTVGAALPLLFCYVVVFRQMGEFISVCTCFSFAVAITLIAPATCIAADLAGRCSQLPGSTDVDRSAASRANAKAGPVRRRSPGGGEREGGSNGGGGGGEGEGAGGAGGDGGAVYAACAA